MEPWRIQRKILLVARGRTRIVERLGVDLPDAPSIVDALPVYSSQYVGLRLSDLQLVVVGPRDDEIANNGLPADCLLRSISKHEAELKSEPAESRVEAIVVLLRAQASAAWS